MVTGTRRDRGRSTNYVNAGSRLPRSKETRNVGLLTIRTRNLQPRNTRNTRKKGGSQRLRRTSAPAFTTHERRHGTGTATLARRTLPSFVCFACFVVPFRSAAQISIRSYSTLGKWPKLTSVSDRNGLRSLHEWRMKTAVFKRTMNDGSSSRMFGLSEIKRATTEFRRRPPLSKRKRLSMLGLRHIVFVG